MSTFQELNTKFPETSFDYPSRFTARNEITGKSIQTVNASDAYKDGWDRIFGKKKEELANDEEKEQDGVSSEQ